MGNAESHMKIICQPNLRRKMDKKQELKDRWKRYVESYGDDTSKRMHLFSATHVVNKIIDSAFEDKQ